MRALIAVFIVLGLIAWGIGHQIEQESQDSKHHGSTQKQEPKLKFEATLELPDSGHAVNVIASYVPGAHLRERQVDVMKYSDGIWVKSPQAAAFVTFPKGVRLMRGPKAKLVRGSLIYTYPAGDEAMAAPLSMLWDGEGLAPFNRVIPLKNNHIRRLSLREIHLRIYDPRFPEATKMGG